MRTKITLGTVAAFGATAALMLTACGSSPPAASSPEQSTTVVLRALAACFRTHGLPDFPDPVIGSDGVPRFPDSAPSTPVSAQQACKAIADRLPPNYTDAPPVLSAAQYRQLLRFARCMRTHGIPDWPDPNSRGQFQLPPRLQDGGKQLILTAMRPCAGLDPNP